MAIRFMMDYYVMCIVSKDGSVLSHTKHNHACTFAPSFVLSHANLFSPHWEPFKTQRDATEFYNMNLYNNPFTAHSRPPASSHPGHQHLLPPPLSAEPGQFCPGTHGGDAITVAEWDAGPLHLPTLSGSLTARRGSCSRLPSHYLCVEQDKC